MTESRTTWTFQPTGRTGQRQRREVVAAQLELLSRAPLFRGLAKTHLRRIAQVSGSRRFRAGEELVKEGVAGSVFFVIVQGRAKVVRGRRTMTHLGPGDFLGEMAILTGAPRNASVVSETPMECLTLSATALRTVLRSEPAIAFRMLTGVAERVARAEGSPTA
jgi:CRP-like cAMP-binding protein